MQQGVKGTFSKFGQAANAEKSIPPVQIPELSVLQSKQMGRVLGLIKQNKLESFLLHACDKQQINCVVANSWSNLARKVEIFRPHLIVVEDSVGKVNALEIVPKLRKLGFKDYIVAISTTEANKNLIETLNVGADDYFAPPLEADLVGKKLLVKLQRLGLTAAPTANAKMNKIILNHLEINYARRSVKSNGKYITLYPIEFDLLWHLATNSNRVISRVELLKTVNSDIAHCERTITAYVSKLRKKLSLEENSSCDIKLVYGVGYYFLVKPAISYRLAS